MHRSSLALAVARLPAVQLGGHPFQVSAFGDHVPVAAMGGDHVVIRAQEAAHADAAGLLADREVDEAGDLSGGEMLSGHGLELAYGHHTAIQVQ